MAPRLSPADRLAGAAFFALYRLAGLLLLPLLRLHRPARPFLHRLPGPEPGWTWVHGASAGEHRVVAALRPHLPPTTWVTRSSWRTPVPGAQPAPLDLPGVADRWIRHHRPGRLILVEAELWPGWLVACRRLGVPVTVVHARDSRGTRRWRRLGPLWRWLTAGVTFVDQSETGDLKVAAPPPPVDLRLPPGAVVAASTRSGDEARVLAAWRRLEPRPPLVLAPRHLHRVEAVARLLAREGVAAVRRTAGQPPGDAVLLLDTQGELAGVTPQATAVVVGGTWDPALGGHSPAEAFAAGLPVVAGPHRHGNPAAWGLGRCFGVEGGAGAAALARALREALAAGRGPAPAGAGVALALARVPAPVQVPEQPARPALAPLVPLVRAAGALRPAWRGSPEDAGGPVVSVGGLCAGGVGKTPVVAWLAQRLPGAWVVARGYRRGPGPPLRVGRPGAPPEHDLGDELEMLRRRGVCVVSAPDRVAGARAAFAAGARLVLVDDGFQHRRLRRDLDLLCLDARWPGGEGPLPVGTRREPWSALGRADWLWWHHAPDLHPQPDPALGAPAPPGRPTIRSRVLPLLDPIPPGPVPVALGLARPEGALCALLRLGVVLGEVTLVPDHRPLGRLAPGTVVTEKDAARLPPDADVRVLRMDLEVAGAQPLLDRIAALVPG